MAHKNTNKFDIQHEEQNAFVAKGSGGLPESAGFVTAAWVKRRYSISNSTLYKWMAEGHFPKGVRVGPRAVRWTLESLLAFEATLPSGE